MGFPRVSRKYVPTRILTPVEFPSCSLIMHSASNLILPYHYHHSDLIIFKPCLQPGPASEAHQLSLGNTLGNPQASHTQQLPSDPIAFP